MGIHRGRRRLLALTGALLASAASLSGGSARAAIAEVDEVGTSFRPPQVEITVGDTVVWTNRSNTSHSVTFQDGPDLHPGCMPSLLGPVNCQDPGDRVQHTFAAAGNHAYYCKLHPANMRGVVVVSPAATTSTAAPSTTATTRPTTTTSITSTTVTTRPLATSSTMPSSTTTSTTAPDSSVLLPGDPPPFPGEGSGSSATGGGGGGGDGGDTATVALIVGLLLAVSAGGGYLLWRLRPGHV